MQYRIGEFAKLSGLSIKTLRYYDRIGLLQPAHIDARTQYRSYVPDQLQKVAAIAALKELGATLEDIKRVLQCRESRDEQLRLLTKLRRTAQCSIEAARRSLVWIESAMQSLDQGERDIPVILRKRPAVRVASVRAQARSYDEIGTVERDLHRALDGERVGATQGVLWHRCAASGSIEGEPFVEVSARARRCGAYSISELPDAVVATAYCQPTDRDAERVYDAVSRWIHLHDFALAAPKREIYVGQLLEVQFPVRSL
jgi:DNA-binding transcriptional MerR regulator